MMMVHADRTFTNMYRGCIFRQEVPLHFGSLAEVCAVGVLLLLVVLQETHQEMR